jgi:hypothetical protein
MKIAVELAEIHMALISTNLSENLKSRSEKMKARLRDSIPESRSRTVVRRA